MEKGYLSLVLHAHLPYVRHPEYEDFLEEDWLFEAITETYIPLIKILQKLAAENIKFRITMSLTPPLLSMLADEVLQKKYTRHLEKLIELSEKEIKRTEWQPQFNENARMYNRLFREAYDLYVNIYHRNLIPAFRELQDHGVLEIITSAASHGYLPLMEIVPEAVYAQIKIGVETHRHFLGRPPRGIWLPECGFYPGLDEILKKMNLRFFFCDAHGLLFAKPRPKYGIFAPLYCPSGVAAFGRDLESSKQVWSAEEGYPGDYDYREFYRDIGYDLDYDYIRPYLHSCGIRSNTGLKYYKITGRTHDKQPYNWHQAREKAAIHAGNFMFNREKQIEYLAEIMDRRPIIVSPYDAELFGHWWFEGPQWLDYVIRKIVFDQKTIKLITPGDYLEIYPRNQVAVPTASSWGYKGYHEVWMEGSNDWIYRHLHHIAANMVELANQHQHPAGIVRRALNQAARELLLAQSSDWAFIMKTGTMTEYAIKRTKTHIRNFNMLYEQIKYNHLDDNFLRHLEYLDNIFPHIDYKSYASDTFKQNNLPLEIATAVT